MQINYSVLDYLSFFYTFSHIVNIYIDIIYILILKDVSQPLVLFRFDTGKDGYLDLGELKRMMEKLGVPQTHLALKAMIKEVDEDCDDKISFREVCILPIIL